MKRRLYILGAVLFVAMVVCWIAAIWTNDERWGYTGGALMIPVFFTFMGASLAPKGRQW